MAKREMPKKNEEQILEPVAPIAEEVIDTAEAKLEEVVDTTSIGTVVGCAKLNIRKKPSTDGKIIAVVDAKTKLTVINDKSIPNWYHVETSDGVKGYCMSKYLNVK